MKKAYGLSPAFALALEEHLYALAGQQLEGYTGGRWGEFNRNYRRNDRWFALPPEQAKYHLSNSNNYSDETCDRFTAGAALTVVAWNHAHWYVANRGRIDQAANEAISREFYTMKDCCLSDTRVNTSQFLSIID